MTEGAHFLSKCRKLSKHFETNLNLTFVWIDPEPFPSVSIFILLSTNKILLDIYFIYSINLELSGTCNDSNYLFNLAYFLWSETIYIICLSIIMRNIHKIIDLKLIYDIDHVKKHYIIEIYADTLSGKKKTNAITLELKPRVKLYKNPKKIYFVKS